MYLYPGHNMESQAAMSLLYRDLVLVRLGGADAGLIQLAKCGANFRVGPVLDAHRLGAGQRA